MPKTVHLIVVGYAPRENIVDPEILADYVDFPVGRTFELEDARACLKRGVFPPGLVLYSPGGRVGRVTGVYEREDVEVIA